MKIKNWKLKIARWCLVTGIFALIALPALSAYAQVLGLPEGPSLPVVAARLINIFLSILGVIAVIIIVVAGALWMTSGGDAEKIERAKKMLEGAVIGVVLILSSYAIARYFFKQFEASGLVGQTAGGGGGGGLPSVPANAFLIESITPPEVPPAPVLPRNVAIRIRFNAVVDPTTFTTSDIAVKMVARIAADDGTLLTTPEPLEETIAGEARLVDERTVVWRPGAVCPPSGDAVRDAQLAHERCFTPWRKINVTIAASSIAAEDARALHCGNGKCTRNFAVNAAVDLEPPHIRITNPLQGTIVPGARAGANVSIRTEVTDDSGVAEVLFRADDRRLGAVSETPYQWVWDTSALSVDSRHELKAQAWDYAEHTAEATPVSVRVGRDVGDTCSENGQCVTGQCAVGRCTGICTTDAQCGAGRCINGRCTFTCTGRGECSSGSCVAGACVACTEASQCAAGQQCVAGQCRVGGSAGSCTTNTDCTSGQTCNAGRCEIAGSTERRNPRITAIDPQPAPVGQIVTITGVNFGASVGRVLFVRADQTQVAGEGLPLMCGPNFWTATQILVKVPRTLELGSVNVFVERADHTTSPEFNFSIGGSPRPNLCRIEPASGPAGITAITLYGERFGNTRGKVLFHDAVEVVGEGLTRWGNDTIATTIPLDAESGPLRVIDATGTLSNALPLRVGACEVGNPASCGTGHECCADGTCRVSGSCTNVAPRCMYEWSFTTETDPERAPTRCTTVADCITSCPDPDLAPLQACINNTCRPLVHDFGPSDGAPGTWVTVRGCHFGTKSGVVTFRGGPGSADDRTGIALDAKRCGPTWTNTQIIIEVPNVPTRSADDDARTGGIKVVTTRGLEATHLDPTAIYTVNDRIKPGICRLDPRFGKEKDEITVIGQNFGDERPSGSFVRFSGLPALGASVSKWANGEIAVTVPAGLEEVKRVTASGAVVDTIVSLLEGTPRVVSSNAVDFYLPPYITKLTPATGPAATWTTIFGGNFGTRPGIVTFNGRTSDPLPAWCTSIWTDTQIIAKAPVGFETGLVRVTTAADIITTDSDSRNFERNDGLPLAPGLCRLATAYCTKVTVSACADELAICQTEAGTNEADLRICTVNNKNCSADVVACVTNPGRGPTPDTAVVWGDGIGIPQVDVSGVLNYTANVPATVATWERTQIGHTIPEKVVVAKKTIVTASGPMSVQERLSKVVGRRCSGIRIGDNCLLGAWQDVHTTLDVASNPLQFTLVSRLGLGQRCTNNHQCASGLCVNRICVPGFTVIDFAPNCQAACVNTSRYARLGEPVDSDSLRNNVILGVCRDAACAAQNILIVPGVTGTTVMETSILKEAVIENGVTKKEAVIINIGRIILNIPPAYNNGVLLPATAYRAILKGGATGIRSAGNEVLQKPNLDYDGDVGHAPESFSWVFRTKDDPRLCQPSHIDVVPAYVRLTSLEPPESRAIEQAYPVGSPDACDAHGQTLDPYPFDWQWTSSRPNVATISTVAMCGNFVVEASEECDDGNTADGDRCSNRCLWEGSACYQEMTARGLRCTGGPAETAVPTSGSICNNYSVEEGEECEGGVGCSTQCLRAGTSAGTATCGNSVIEPGEECDPGDADHGGGCNNYCLREGARPYTEGGTCGNGVVDRDVATGAGEDCDDDDARTGTTPLSGDGCAANCLWEGRAPEVRDAAGVVTRPATHCGNGTLEHGEECEKDKGVMPSYCGYGYGERDQRCILSGSLGMTVGAGSCGNGILETGEDCDDGGQCANQKACVSNQDCSTVPGDKTCTPLSGDGCSNRCLNEGSAKTTGQGPIQFVTATGAGQTGPNTTCGDGMIKFNESCIQTRTVGGPTGQGVVGVTLSGPAVQIVSRAPEGPGACPASFIQMTFSEAMDLSSFVADATIQLIGPCTGNTCPSTAPHVAGLRFETNEETIVLDDKGTSATDDDVVILPHHRVLVSHPLFDRGKRYQVVLRRDRPAPAATPQAGIRSQAGGTLIADVRWMFVTDATVEQCKIDRIEVNIDPTSPTLPTTQDRFLCAGRNDCDGDQLGAVNGNQHRYRAYAYQACDDDPNTVPPACTEALLVVPWTWAESSPDGGVVSLVVDSPGTALVTPVADQTAKKGDEVITVTANSDTTSREYREMGIASTQVVASVFLCDNPWPALTTFPWRMSGPADPINMTLFYCRDAGAPGTVDDLPAMQTVNVNTPTTPDVLREYLFRNDSDSSTIGLRIFRNQFHFSAADWYSVQPFPKGTGIQPTVMDGYEGIVDGRSTYVHVPDYRTDADGANARLESRIVLFSVSQGAAPATLEILEQMKTSAMFNTNADPVIVDDPNPEVDSPKDKLRRDTKRIEDLQRVAGWLDNYKKDTRNRHCELSIAKICRPADPACVTDRCASDECPSGESCVATYPLLSAGTFVPGLSTSRWPSWTAALGNTVRKALPTDPVNKFGSCTEADAASCWNEQELKYQCPVGSQIYQYRILDGGAEYELASKFEYNVTNGAESAPTWRYQNPDPHLLLTNACGGGGVYGATGFCGDGRINPFEGENCDMGTANHDDWRSSNNALTCNTICNKPPPYCGDGHRDKDYEECDPTDTTRAGLGVHQVCRADCQARTLNYCGDGNLTYGQANEEGIVEWCDGTTLKQSQVTQLAQSRWRCDTGVTFTGCAANLCRPACKGGVVATRCASEIVDITGTVVDTQGDPVVGATVNLVDTSGSFVLTSTTTVASSGSGSKRTPRGGFIFSGVAIPDQEDRVLKPIAACTMKIMVTYGRLRGEAPLTRVRYRVYTAAVRLTGADICGDGVRTGAEICDEGAANSNTWAQTSHCNATCTGSAPYCGDGTRNGPEKCDPNDWGRMGLSLGPQCPANCTLP